MPRRKNVSLLDERIDAIVEGTSTRTSVVLFLFHFIPDEFQLLLRADVEKMIALEKEERQFKEENIRLQRRLLLEQERRENLGRQLSESESSLEMEDERYYWSNHSQSAPESPSAPAGNKLSQKTENERLFCYYLDVDASSQSNYSCICNRKVVYDSTVSFAGISTSTRHQIMDIVKEQDLYHQVSEH